jgi:hypothetical protein
MSTRRRRRRQKQTDNAKADVEKIIKDEEETPEEKPEEEKLVKIPSDTPVITPDDLIPHEGPVLEVKDPVLHQEMAPPPSKEIYTESEDRKTNVRLIFRYGGYNKAVQRLSELLPIKLKDNDEKVPDIATLPKTQNFLIKTRMTGGKVLFAPAGVLPMDSVIHISKKNDSAIIIVMVNSDQSIDDETLQQGASSLLNGMEVGKPRLLK